MSLITNRSRVLQFSLSCHLREVNCELFSSQLCVRFILKIFMKMSLRVNSAYEKRGERACARTHTHTCIYVCTFFVFSALQLAKLKPLRSRTINIVLQQLLFQLFENHKTTGQLFSFAYYSVQKAPVLFHSPPTIA